MKIQQPTKTLTITFNEAEIRYIRDITQNYMGANDANSAEGDIRLALFIATSEALGVNRNPNGSAFKGKL